ncbi:MAG: peptidase MA family metallohydrolase, partial [Pirellulaceae bacterium]|nr:peptidase MA family metallohydrolase [Pirellulaceae bacterium]
REPRAWAHLAVLAHLRGDQVGENVLRSTGLASWPENPAVDFLVGRKLAQKYRFAEAAAYQRSVLKVSPDHLPAKFELSQALLRLGQEEEGMRLAKEVNQQDGYNVVAHNLVTLQNNLKRFQTLETPGFVVRMEPREAQLYGQRALDLLGEAKATLCAKYNVTIDERVLVEIFPRQADFAIRTFGLPGGDGFLGVCFGRVITANSPASRGNTPANWEAVLWHEFCHVVTLEKTHNKMPRWLSEGISVYEERQANATWGQTMTPSYRQMILEGALTPVSQLSGAFLQPPSAMHLQFAYFESSLVVEFLIERHGLETLQRVLDDLGVGMSINDSLARYTGSLELLDDEFATFARQQAEQMAPKADWSEADLPQDADVATLKLWVATHPNHFVAMSRLAAALIQQNRWNDAKTLLPEIIALFPDYHETGNAYTMLAKVHQELGETKEERAVLEELTALSDDDVDALGRLMDLCIEQEDWDAALKTADRLLGINPLIAAPHRVIARAAEQLNDSPGAITALRALVALNPIDPADVHFRLAMHLTELSELSA